MPGLEDTYPNLSEEIVTARKAGYADPEIQKYIQGKIHTATQAGYSVDEINQYLGEIKPPAPTYMERMGRRFSQAGEAMTNLPSAAKNLVTGGGEGRTKAALDIVSGVGAPFSFGTAPVGAAFEHAAAPFVSEGAAETIGNVGEMGTALGTGLLSQAGRLSPLGQSFAEVIGVKAGEPYYMRQKPRPGGAASAVPSTEDFSAAMGGGKKAAAEPKTAGAAPKGKAPKTVSPEEETIQELARSFANGKKPTARDLKSAREVWANIDDAQRQQFMDRAAQTKQLRAEIAAQGKTPQMTPAVKVGNKVTTGDTHAAAAEKTAGGLEAYLKQKEAGKTKEGFVDAKGKFVEEKPKQESPIAKAIVSGDPNRTGEFRIKPQVDARLTEVVASEHNQDMALLATKELMQNSFDALRPTIKGSMAESKWPTGPGVSLKVDLNNKSVRIMDRGAGMGPKGVGTFLIDPGATGKGGIGTTGGLGVAKIPLFRNAKTVHIETVGRNPETRQLQKTVVDFTGADYRGALSDPNHPGFNTKTEVVKEGTPTYTDMAITYPREQQFDAYEVTNFARQYQLYSEFPKEMYDIDINGVNYGKRGTNTDQWGTPLPERQRLPLDKGETPDFSWELKSLGTDLSHGDYTYIAVLNDGAYQHKTAFYLPGNSTFPKDMVVNIRSKVKAEDPRYPFELKREGVKSSVGRALEKPLENVAIKAIAAENKTYLKAFEGGTRIKGAGHLRILDTIGGYKPEEIEHFAARPYITDLATGLEQAYRIIGRSLSRVTGNAAYGDISFAGLGLGEENLLGVNVAGRFLKTPKNLSLIYPTETGRVVGDMLRKGYITVDEAPRRFIDQLMATVTHEITHQVERTERGMSYPLTQAFAVSGPEREMAGNLLFKQLERHGGVNGVLTDLDDIGTSFRRQGKNIFGELVSKSARFEGSAGDAGGLRSTGGQQSKNLAGRPGIKSEASDIRGIDERLRAARTPEERASVKRDIDSVINRELGGLKSDLSEFQKKSAGPMAILGGGKGTTLHAGLPLEKMTDMWRRIVYQPTLTKWARKFYSPRMVSEESRITSEQLIKAHSNVTENMRQIDRMTRRAHAIAGTWTPDKVIDFLSAAETKGATLADPDMEFARKVYRSALDANEAALKSRGLLKQTLESYVPHLFTNQAEAAKAYDLLKRSPKGRSLEGPKYMLQHRTLSGTIQDILASPYAQQKGLRLKYANPFDAMDQIVYDSQRLIAGEDLKNVLKGKPYEYVKHFKDPRKVPDTWEEVQGFKPTKRPIKVSDRPDAPTVFVPTGKWYAPAEVARVLNNYTRPGLMTGEGDLKGLARGYRSFSGIVNSVNLSWSAFHGTATALSSWGNELKRAILSTQAGEYGEAAKRFGAAMIPGYVPARDLRYGNLLRNITNDPKLAATHPETLKLIKGYIDAGGRIDNSRPFFNRWMQDKVRALEDREVLEGSSPILLKAARIGLGTEQLFKRVVEPIKLGAFAKRFQDWIRQNPNMAATDEGMLRGANIVMDQIEDAFGMVNYDRWGIDRRLRDGLFLMLRAPGWSLGNMKILHGGMQDLAAGKLTERSATLVGQMTAATAAGIVFNMAFTHEPPEVDIKKPLESLYNLWNPKTGDVNADGTPARQAMAGIHRDWQTAIFGIGKPLARGMPRMAMENAAKMVTSKLSPGAHILDEWRTNRDFYNRPMIDEAASLPEQAVQFGKAVAKEVAPFSASNVFGARGVGQSVPGWQAGLGLTPAASERITQSAFLDLMAHDTDKRGPKSPAEYQHQEDKTKLANAIANKKDISEIVKGGNINRNDVKDTIKNLAIRQGPQGALRYTLEHSPLDMIAKNATAATVEEAPFIARALQTKFKNSLKRGNMTQAEMDQYLKAMNSLIEKMKQGQAQQAARQPQQPERVGFNGS